MYHTVIPIYNGAFTVTMTVRPGLPTIKDIPSFCFLLKSESGEYTLVDSGFSPEYIPSLEAGWQQEPENRLNNALGSMGIKADQIGMIVQTHMHWDHTAALKMFPQAQIVVQALELRALFHLQPNEDSYYYYDSWITELARMRLVHGSLEIYPGIELIYSGGHSAGHQLVRIQTASGPVILCGDAPFNYDNLWKMIPDKYWDKLRKEKKAQYDWNSQLLPEVSRLLRKQNCWDLPSLEPMGWKRIRQLEGRLQLSHDSTLIPVDQVEAV